MVEVTTSILLRSELRRLMILWSRCYSRLFIFPGLLAGTSNYNHNLSLSLSYVWDGYQRHRLIAAVANRQLPICHCAYGPGSMRYQQHLPDANATGNVVLTRVQATTWSIKVELRLQIPRWASMCPGSNRLR